MLSFLDISKKSTANTVDVQEASSLWNTLAALYQFVEKLHIWKNFAHDTSLKLALAAMNKELKQVIETIENNCKKHRISGPEVGVKAVNTSADTEVLRDELIAQDTFIWLQGITVLLIRAIRTTTTNDGTRKIFMKISKTSLKIMDHAISFLRNKGWINPPLRYPNIPQGVSENIDLSEAFHLWDHLTFRYDNVYLTEMYKDLICDKDFKTLVTAGLQSTLKKQQARLEKECLYFGIPLPKKPAKIIAWPPDTKHFINDDFIYRNLYFGIMGATLMHIEAVKQSLTSDHMRKFFIELLLSEISIQDNLIKYGKIKGFLNNVPKYSLKQG